MLSTRGGCGIPFSCAHTHDLTGHFGIAGIRSTGLTASPAIAEFVAGLYDKMLAADSSSSSCTTPPPVSPSSQNSLGVSRDLVEPPYPAVPLRPSVRVANAPVPPLEELARDFARRRDGTVEIFGRRWLVTHEQTRLGLVAMARRLQEVHHQ